MSRSRSSPWSLPRDAAIVAMQAADDRPRELRQRPDRRDRDRAGADEAHLVPPDVFACAANVDARRGRLQVAVRIGTAPTQAMTSPSSIARPTDRPDEVSRAEERERERDVVAARGALADAEEALDLRRGDARDGQDRRARPTRPSRGRRRSALRATPIASPAAPRRAPPIRPSAPPPPRRPRDTAGRSA